MIGLGLGLGIEKGRSGYDSAAANFFVRASITNTTQKRAINNLVKGLKANNLWNKMFALYPYVGGTLASHSQNLINSSFSISWFGGVTHDANGITGNGVDGQGNCNALRASTLGENGGLTVYRRTNPVGDSNKSMGTDNGVDRIYDIVHDVTTGQSYGRYGAVSAAVWVAPVVVGCYSINRTGPTALNYYRNGVNIATDPTNSVVSALNVNDFRVLAGNAAGIGAFFSEENDALSAFHVGLTAGEVLTCYNLVQTYQTALGRQV